MNTQPIILGTAGHIDHGKTALVAALTGIDTDRLKVEKERGITTELGFAHLDLDGRRFGVVDVPGHERFIKSMVAGAGGLDLVCLVIAADEGIMPQTREHLDICALLGVRRGVIALTKRDLVDDDWLALVTEDVRAELARSFLAEADIVPVSARTGDNLDALKQRFVDLTHALPARPADGIFRLPLDRVFSIRGFGTVVTGTIAGGQVRAGDDIEVIPGGRTAKVRGIEVHGAAVESARAGMRCALNLSGIATSDLTRGDTLAHPGAIAPSHLLDARFRYLATSRAPLPRRSRILFHHGTRQSMATLILVETDTLAPGGEALVQIRLDATEPVAALPGDRFIVRGFVLQEHYGTTLGGGEILRVMAPKVRRSSPAGADAIRDIAGARGRDRVALEIRGADVAATTAAVLSRRLGTPSAELDRCLQDLTDAGEVVRAGGGADTLYCHAEPFARVEAQAIAHLDAFHERNPGKAGISREELRARLPRAFPARLYDVLLEGLARRGAVERDRDVVRRPERRTAMATETPLEASLVARFRDWGVTPPRPQEIAAAVGADAGAVRTALDRLLSRGGVVKIKSDLYLGREPLDALRQKLVAHLEAHGHITPAEWKQLTGASRKYSIPLAEHFDAEKLTLRVGDVRKLRG